MVICLFNLSLYRLHSPTKKQTNECLYVCSSPFEYWSGIDKCAWRIIEFIWVVFFSFLFILFRFVDGTQGDLLNRLCFIIQMEVHIKWEKYCMSHAGHVDAGKCIHTLIPFVSYDSESTVCCGNPRCVFVFIQSVRVAISFVIQQKMLSHK